jgi:hypothetical protein
MKALIIVLLVISFSGCKQTYCPSFPPSLLDYFPYSKGEKLRFENQNNDTLVLFVNNCWATDSYSFSWNCKCSCGADAGFETKMDSIYLIEVSGSLDISNDTRVSIISCTISDEKTSSDDFYYRIDGVDPFLEENYKLFGDTLLFKKDEFYRYNNVLVIRTKGIVQFWDKNHNCNWVKID